MQEMVNESALDNITKEYMLNVIDNLIVYIRGNEQDIANFVQYNIDRMDIYDVSFQLHHYEVTYYKEHPEDFKDDFFQEFLES